jgi:hypothetical protein
MRYWPSIPSLPDRSRRVYFYELHEGDEEVFSDVLLARDDEIDADDFFELVQSVRRQVQESYEDDTLIEAIAAELEREHGFTFVNDDRLTAAVNVSTVEAENFLVAIDTDEEAAEDDRGADYRAVIAEFDPTGEAVRGEDDRNT